ncbi:MAG: 4-hydroxy-3-methylbut-2-enyl diphosphate reductase [Actinomycetota bacterium]
MNRLKSVLLPTFGRPIMTTVARDVVTPTVYRCNGEVIFEAVNNVDEVILASPRGFCAGVEMAIKALAWMVRTFDAPVYCYHEIVHNKIVVDRFKNLGVIFVDDLSEIPKGRPIMLSAHGSAPQVVAAARELGSYVVDSVCPLVTKVHHEVKTRANKGYRIVYIGHDGHEEAVGTMAVAPDSISRVETLAEVDALANFIEPVAILAQTTLSHRDWKDVADAVRLKYPDVWSPGKSDLCFATTNRQGALMEIARECNAIVVIGSENSSNTRALEKLAKDVGCKNVYRVNDASELPNDLSGIVGVTAGASAPEELVAEIIRLLAPKNGVREVKIAQEDEYFPPPRHIRQLQAAIELVATAMLGGSHDSRRIVDDKKVAASTVLAQLAN